MKKDLGVLRIIPCLDVKDGRVVKGINFVDLRDAGDPFESAKVYGQEGADEICVLDISASVEGRRASLEMIRKIAQNVFVPITVGGGVRTPEDMREYLKYGADKVSINTGAVENPKLIKECAERFGSQCVVVAIDAKRVDGKFKVFIYSGKKETDLDAVDWAKRCEELGCGEILLTSIDKDGTQEGYDLELLTMVLEAVSVPVIASGGAGSKEHFLQAAKIGTSACLAASVFHYGKIKIGELKDYLKDNHIYVRTD
ncbi:MAG: imidazole glycerol phosphate synthase subunit HisF [Candidatus Calescibacterium sp.]|nr:imidazole glycerol phosphate synthase subunit HisF [Candidatus Calescibacterium sp.]MCX7733490.1 imidazole glycerol phosphate synthase subunit HisF [bacterium]MDW8087412.1 imidazole glycerol phosphate synthase subunit HisF [Candidatus Calescibacterium sp.]